MNSRASLLSPVICILGHPQPVQMGPSMRFLQEAFQMPSALRESTQASDSWVGVQEHFALLCFPIAFLSLTRCVGFQALLP